MEEGLGAGFWLKLIGIVLAEGIAAILLSLLVAAAWYRWGAIGALIFFSALVLLWGWIYDRRHAKEYERLRQEAKTSKIEETGKPLRAMMSWLGSAAKEMDE